MKPSILLIMVFALIVGGCANKPQVVLKDDVKKLSRNVVYINLKTGEMKGE